MVQRGPVVAEARGLARRYGKTSVFAGLDAAFEGSFAAWQQGGTMEFLLGTDHLGRDVLSRLIFGARVSLVGSVGVGWGRYGAIVSGPADTAAMLPGAPVSYLRAGFGCEYER